MTREAQLVGVPAAVVVPAVAAHVAAGGALAWTPVLVAFALTTLAAHRVRWTFPRLVTAVALAQPVLHVALGMAHPTPEQHHAGHTVHAAHADGRMVAAHLTITLVAAVGLRWGVRWLRTLPTLARALVDARPRLALAVPQFVATVRTASVALRQPVLAAAHGSRGPPR